MKWSRGQSIIEILVAAGVGALLVVGAVSVVVSSLRTNQATNNVQLQAQAGTELVNNIQSWAPNNWNAVASIVNADQYYYLNTTSSPFTVAIGAETVSFGSSTFTRYFRVFSVYRDSNGYVTTTVAGNVLDPSTDRVNVFVQGGSTSTPYQFITYVTRNEVNTFAQNSWAGGSGAGTVTVASNTYATSSNLSISATGSIQIMVNSTGTCTL